MKGYGTIITYTPPLHSIISVETAPSATTATEAAHSRFWMSGASKSNTNGSWCVYHADKRTQVEALAVQGHARAPSIELFLEYLRF